jgi:hypothetical protein
MIKAKPGQEAGALLGSENCWHRPLPDRTLPERQRRLADPPPRCGEERYRQAPEQRLKPAAPQHPWREDAPDPIVLGLEHVALLVNGLGDRQIAEHLDMTYETARSCTQVTPFFLTCANTT